MAAFTSAEVGNLDWTLLQNGAITLYSAMSPLERDLGWLSDHGYAAHRFDCANSTTFQAQISLAPKLGGCEASWNWDEFFTERRMRAAAAAPGEQGCPGKPA